MPQPITCGIKGERPDIAASYNRSSNSDLTDLSTIDPNMIRKPDYFVYVFSVADRGFDVSRPALNLSRLRIPFNREAITNPDAYELVWRVPSPYPLPYADQTTGEVKLNTVNAERIAMDICNPNNKSVDMDGYVAPESIIGAGDDLIAKGLFYVHERDCKFVDADGMPCDKDAKDKEGRPAAFPVPPASAVATAVERKRKYYNGLLDKGKALEYSDQRALADYVGAEPDVHLACEYFGVETSFHKVRLQKAVPVDCPICGTEMKRGAAFHPLAGSKLGVCVNNWDRAIEAGVVSEEDRPKKPSKTV